MSKLRRNLSAWIRNQYQLVIRNKQDLAEKSVLTFSYASLASLGTIFVIVLVSCSLLLSTTILDKWLNPAHVARENEKQLAQLSTEVGELEQQAKHQKKIIVLLQSIIEGKEPPAEELASATQQEADAYQPDQYTPEQLAQADDSLQKEFEDETPELWEGANKSFTDLQELCLCSPVDGIISTPFRRTLGHYGIDIATRKRAPIKCIADGMVISSTWTAEDGWVIMVQHSGNLVSVYKHNASLLQKVGSFVKSGEVIAVVGDSGHCTQGHHLHLELWHAGNAINPKHFIIF